MDSWNIKNIACVQRFQQEVVSWMLVNFYCYNVSPQRWRNIFWPHSKVFRIFLAPSLPQYFKVWPIQWSIHTFFAFWRKLDFVKKKKLKLDSRAFYANFDGRNIPFKQHLIGWPSLWHFYAQIILASGKSGYVVKTGLEIRHFEKNSRRKKLKTQGKNSITQE